MNEFKLTYYEVHVLSKDGWTLHARYPGSDRKVALTEAKAAESRLAAATKVVRTEYSPHTNEEYSDEIYASRLAASEAEHRHAGISGRRPRPAAPRRRPTPPQPVAPAEPRSGVGVLLQLIGIMVMAGLVASLIAMVVGTVFGEYLTVMAGRGDAQRGFLFGTFIVFFLLIAVPPIVSLARSVGDVQFGFGDGGSDKPKRPAKPHRPAKAGPPPAAAVAPEGDRTPDADPLGAVDALVLAAEDAADADAEAEPQPPPQLEPDQAPAAAPDETEELLTPTEMKASRRRMAAARQPFMRFLAGVVGCLRETRPHLDSYERFGLGLLILGAGNALAESARLRERERRALLAEAMGVFGHQGTRAEAMVADMEAQAQEARGARMVEAGFEAMRQFARGGRDFLAAVLTALETWNRPAGATGLGVVAALVIEAWPLDRAQEEAVREAAHANGGAVLGMTEGIILLFPGAARAVEVARELVTRLPQASRMGVDAVEAVSEEEAVRCVGTARAACQSAGPGQIRVTMAVRGLCSRTSLPFRNVGGAGALELAELVLDPGTGADADTPEWGDTAPPPASDAATDEAVADEEARAASP